MATRKKPPAANLHREIAELAVTMKYLADKIEAVRKVSEANAERIRWYDFWMKAGRVIGIAAVALITLKLGDLPKLAYALITEK